MPPPHGPPETPPPTLKQIHTTGLRGLHSLAILFLFRRFFVFFFYKNLVDRFLHERFYAIDALKANIVLVDLVYQFCVLTL